MRNPLTPEQLRQRIMDGIPQCLIDDPAFDVEGYVRMQMDALGWSDALVDDL